jgi:hypothetical protein
MEDRDYITRVWPSGILTIGIPHTIGYSHYVWFLSLEDYSDEGGVKKGDVYGMGQQGSPYTHRKSTPMEVKLFEYNGKLQMKEDLILESYRDLKLDKLLGEKSV